MIHHISTKFRGICRHVFKNAKPDFHCNICGRDVRFALDSSKFNSEVFEKERVIGGGYRKRQKCPYCFSTDRLRFTEVILERYTGIYTDKCSVLEFAPIVALSRLLKKNKDLSYISGDIVEGRADMVLDITDIDRPDNSFDYILCCHVLEHIPDEAKAVSELMRVSKNGGKLLLSMPFSLKNDKTLEDKNVKTDAERLKLYGQDDHVRLYGTDIKKHLESYGLEVEEYTASACLTEEEMKTLKVIPEDRNYICTVRK